MTGDAERLDRVVRGLQRLGIRQEIEIEIIRSLIHGHRTVGELVGLIFGAGLGSEDFHSCYMRVWRAIRELESRGLVSGPLWGRDRAYRLTRHGAWVLNDLAVDPDRLYWGFFSGWDIIMLVSTLLVGVVVSYVARDLLLVFAFLLGASSYRVLVCLRGVW